MLFVVALAGLLASEPRPARSNRGFLSSCSCPMGVRQGSVVLTFANQSNAGVQFAVSLGRAVGRRRAARAHGKRSRLHDPGDPPSIQGLARRRNWCRVEITRRRRALDEATQALLAEASNPFLTDATVDLDREQGEAGPQPAGCSSWRLGCPGDQLFGAHSASPGEQEARARRPSRPVCGAVRVVPLSTLGELAGPGRFCAGYPSALVNGAALRARMCRRGFLGHRRQEIGMSII